jgi:hypothetical protein
MKISRLMEWRVPGCEPGIDSREFLGVPGKIGDVSLTDGATGAAQIGQRRIVFKDGDIGDTAYFVTPICRQNARPRAPRGGCR